MSELEQRLRNAYDALPLPTEEETAAARRAVLTAASTPIVRRRRPVLMGVAAVLAVAAGFGGGWAVASSMEAPAKPARTSTLNAGPGFLPTQGWDIAASAEMLTLQAPVAIAANIPLSDEDRRPLPRPRATARRLGPTGILFRVLFHPAGTTRAEQRLLPLQLADAVPVAAVEDMPIRGSARRLRARIGRYEIDVLILFGAESPAAGVLAAAARQLGRLVVPACPDALPLTPADLPAAETYVLDWLRHSYQDDPADLAGARAQATLGTAMPRAGAARTACGLAIASRTVEVDVVLPKLEPMGASLSQLSYFASRTREGWQVWQRIH